MGPETMLMLCVISQATWSGLLVQEELRVREVNEPNKSVTEALSEGNGLAALFYARTSVYSPATCRGQIDSHCVPFHRNTGLPRKQNACCPASAGERSQGGEA